MITEGSEEEKLYVTISGNEQFVAGDIETNTNTFKVMNPELYICTLEPNVTLEIEFTVTKGRGYVPAEIAYPSNEDKRTLLNELPIVWPNPGSKGLNSKTPSKSSAF